MRIQLVKKLADIIDGVDISDYAVGDVMDLHTDEARLLIAEGWALSVGLAAHRRDIRQSSRPTELAEAADSTRSVVNQLRRASKQIEQQGGPPPQRRRREGIVLDELRDGSAKTIQR